LYACPEGASREHAIEALAVFNGAGPDFRDMLRTLQERSARAERFEDAARYRDAARALDRTLAALAVANRSTADDVVVVLEGEGRAMAATVLVHGWRFTTLRFEDAELSGDALHARLLRVLRRATRRARTDTALTAQRLRDTMIIDDYRQQHAPVWVPVADAEVATEQVLSMARRTLRVPRKRHEAS
jgi:excinuclease UvrABC nuclease subunit